VTTSRTNIKRVRTMSDVTDSLVTAETTEEDEDGVNVKRRRVLEVKLPSLSYVEGTVTTEVKLPSLLSRRVTVFF
jgi:hypothetical protein